MKKIHWLAMAIAVVMAIAAVMVALIIVASTVSRVRASSFATGIAAGALLSMSAAEEGSSVGGSMILYKDTEAMLSTNLFALRIAWHYMSRKQTIWGAFECAIGKKEAKRSKLILVLYQDVGDDLKLTFFYEMKPE